MNIVYLFIIQVRSQIFQKKVESWVKIITYFIHKKEL